MKKFMSRIMSRVLTILAVMLLLINSSFMLVISTAIDAIENAIDESKINSILEMNLEKYVNYKLDEQSKGTLVQLNVKTGIEYADGQEYKPLESTETVLQAPKIEDQYPEKVEFIAKSTKATNGDSNAKDIGYEYNQQDGTVKVTVQNKEDEQGNIYSENVANARDEYVVIYYYGANCYNAENIKRELEFKAKSTQTIHNDEKTKIEKENTNNQEVTENIGGLISTNVTTSDVYNGYIYSNINNGTNNDTEYTENTRLDISYKEISDEILINQNTKFIDTKDKEVETQEIVYKGLKINKQNIINVLGEDFKISILNDAGEIIKELNKDTEVNENNEFDINYDTEYANINFKFSKPMQNGFLQIENKKAIKSTMKTLENNKIKLTQEIICQNNAQEENGQIQQISTCKVENTTEIQNSESDIELYSDKTQLTNNIKNDVTLIAVLKTNESKYNLFKNPVIEIEMPSEVENVILGNVSLLYDNNLKIKNCAVQDKNGIKVIKITVDGTQSNYNNSSISEGANIIIPATIMVNKDIYSTQSSIKMTYSNETGITTSYEKQGKECQELQVDIDSINVPESTITAQSETQVGEQVETQAATNTGDTVSNVSLDGLKVENVTTVGDTTVKDGDTVYEKEVINYNIKVTNTTETEMNNCNVKATVPDGTTYILKDGSWADKGSTDTAGTRNDLEVKYPDTKEITKNLETLEAGQSYILRYSVIVNDLADIEPKDIQNKIYINETEIENQTKLVAKKSKMKLNIYPADKELGQYKNMYIFEATVFNTTDEKITNVKAETTLSNEMELNYVSGATNEYDETTKKLKINVGDIEANSSKLIAVRVNAVNFKEGVSEYTIPFDLNTYGDNTDTYRGDTQYVQAYSADISVKMESPTEGQEVNISDEVQYNVTIKNTGTVNEYITVVDNLPEYVTPIKAKYNKFEYDSEGKEITQTEEEISLTKKVIIEGEQTYDFKLETIIPKGETINITITGEADIVKEKTDVSNAITVYGKETGAKVSNNIIHTILPYEEEPEGEEEPPDISDEDDYIDDTDVPEDPSDPSNPDNPGDFDDPENPSNPDDPNVEENKTYYISGKAWIDDNKDGIRNSNEQLLKDITVKLFNSDTNAIVVDENGNKVQKTTNDSGEYKFENIKKGNYLVIFEYDSNTYTTTDYQNSKATTATNSDAIAKEVSIDGQTKIVGVTDILNISSNNIENIDIGLLKSKTFDLKLDKYISKITVSNSDGTKEYTYNNKQLAKIDIAAKKLSGSTVTIEYKIVVTNEGELTGEVNEVIDYLPSGMTFDKETNKEWYKGYDGNLRNSSLAENQIKPGESKELTLILTKQMTDNSTGTVENIAEIGKATNASYISDRDSVPGNQKEGEDDFSKAQVIISVKTGLVHNFVTFVVLLGILITVAFILKNGKIKNIFKFITVFTAVIFIGGYVFVANAKGSTEGFENNVIITYKKSDKFGTSTDKGASSAVWIEKVDTNDDDINDTWTYGPSYSSKDKMSKDSVDLSPGFICISPGYHICTNEGHRYILNEDVSVYRDWNRFSSDMNQDYYENFENSWKDLSGINEEFFTDTVTDNNQTNLIKRESDVKVTNTNTDDKNSQDGIVCGPFKYNLKTKNKDVWIDIEDYDYIMCDKSGTNIKGGIPAEMYEPGDHEFYLKPAVINNDKITYVYSGAIRVVVAITTKSVSGTRNGVKVGVYEEDPTQCSDCQKSGSQQTFIRLRAFSEPLNIAYPESIHWNVKLNRGKLTIYKKGDNDENVDNIKFKITQIIGNNSGKEYIRWTKNGKIELNNIPMGYYKIKEIESKNIKYPISIQTNDYVNINNIEDEKEWRRN